MENGELINERLKKALFLVCEYIADCPQTYEEVGTADIWMERFLEEAKSKGKGERNDN